MAKRKKKRRPKSEPRPSSSGLGQVRIPPWLFYTIAGLFAIAVVSMLLWAMLNPGGG